MKEIYDVCNNKVKTPDYCNYSVNINGGLVSAGVFQFLMPISQTLSASVSNGTFNPSMLKMMEFLNSYTKLKAVTRKTYGAQAKDFIQYCSFKGIVCSADDFEITQNIQFGNCFTFKPLFYAKSLTNKSSFLLDNNDLEIILNLETGSYVTYISKSMGALATIHHMFEEPRMEEKSILVSPGFETIIKIKSAETKRLPAPYEDKCMDYRSEKLNPRDCILLCIQEINHEICGCVDPTVDIFLEDTLTCDMTNIKHILCLGNVIDNLLIHHENCNCNVPCFSIDYNEQVWRSSWPSRKYFDSYLSLKFNLSKDLKSFKNDHAFLKIHLETTKIIIEQKPLYDISEFFSSLGGSLGLFLGISCMTVFEILEILIVILNHEFI
nr:degenerin unc-8-like [Parasteatoda tepidariorum]